MSSDSTDVGEVPHYAYMMLIIFPPFPTEIVVLCHHAKINDIFLPSGRVGPSPLTKTNMVEICMMEAVILHIGFRLPSDTFSKMYLYWEQTFTQNYFEITYSLYVAYVVFRDFIDSLETLVVLNTLPLELLTKRNYST